MGWLIDTDIWIAVERGALSAADIHAITRQEPIYLSPINIAEICFGLELLKASAKKRQATAMLRRLRRKPQLRITVQTAEQFGALVGDDHEENSGDRGQPAGNRVRVEEA